MFFLNLSAVEFLALLGALSAAITALYLLDRRKRRRVVSTLRFWTAAANVEERRSRRHMQQPWSLLLQLLSLLLLLLAIARLQWGSRPDRARDHVVLVDTSAWSSARASASSATVLDEERRNVRSLLRSLPVSDRVLLISTSALVSTPEPFTPDRKRLASMLDALQPGASALDLDQAVRFAQAAQRWSGNNTGQIVYVGPARTLRPPASLPPNFRVIRVPAPEENVGIRAASARRSDEGGTGWSASFTLHNDGARPHAVHLQTGFAGTAFASRRYTLAPGGEVTADYSFVTHTSGLLKASIEEPDSVDADNQVQLDLHDRSHLRLGVVTRRRDRLLPLLGVHDMFSVEYVDPLQYRAAQYRAGGRPDIWIFDEFTPPQPVKVPALFIHPPRDNAPLPIKSAARDALVSSWNVSAFGDAGLRTHELRLPVADVFETFKGDTTIASIPQGPVVVARGSSRPKLVAIGFDLLSDTYRTDLTTPLLMANALSWLAPSMFHADEFTALRTGAVSLPLEANETASSLLVTDEQGRMLPFSFANGNLQLFSDRAQSIRIASDTHARELALRLPDVSAAKWEPPASVVRSAAVSLPSGPLSADLWQWLAAAGGLGLLLEWILFGQARKRSIKPGEAGRRPAAASGSRAARSEERLSA